MPEIRCICDKVLLEYGDDLSKSEIKRKLNKLVEKDKISRWRMWVKNELNPNIPLQEEIYLCESCLEKSSKKIKPGTSYKEVFIKLKEKIDKKNNYLK